MVAAPKLMEAHMKSQADVVRVVTAALMLYDDTARLKMNRPFDFGKH